MNLFAPSEAAEDDLEQTIPVLARVNPDAALTLAADLERTFNFHAQWPGAGRLARRS